MSKPAVHLRAILRSPRIAAVGIALAIALPIAIVPWPRFFLWNASASVPEGLYYIDRQRAPYVGSLAISWLPDGARRLAATRRYLPSNVPLIKPVAAGTGQTVCRMSTQITVDGVPRAVALTQDSRGRPLPVWQGCMTLRLHQLFLMNSDVRDSFDGRYFGPTDVRLVIGRAVPLYTIRGAKLGLPRRPEESYPASSRSHQ